jgi:Mg-chelatase subunit ChlD
MSATATVVSDGVTACIEITPIKAARAAVDLVAIVDISGSMGTSAEIKTSTGVESHGLSSLNIVQHATQVMIASLTPADQFALVSFHSTVRTEFPLSSMTDSNKETARAATNALRPQESTNLWGGIEQGLNLLPRDTHRLQVVVVQTDGVDNIAPGEGAVEACKTWIRRAKESGRRIPLIYTIGFGTNLESPKLVDLAALSEGGVFEYIHDAASVGTVFCNALANIYSTVATQVKLVFPDRTEIPLGALYADQPKRCLVPAGKMAGAKLSYQPRNSAPVTLELTPVVSGTIPSRELARTDLIRAIEAGLRTVLYDQKRAQDDFKTAIERLSQGDHTDLFQDAIECGKALEFTGSWGLHFLRGMRQNHFQQVCAHFRDIGCTAYSAPARTDAVQALNAIFNALPPPKGSCVTAATVQVQSMSSYNTQRYDDPCFPGWCRTRLADGQIVRLDGLVKGDRLATGGTIECVVKTWTDGAAPLVNLGRLWITPYHPIRTRGVTVRTVTPRLHRTTTGRGGKTWIRSRNRLHFQPAEYAFPCEFGPVVLQSCSAVYSFVLTDKHVINVEGYDCVTLGHNFREDKARHAYLGTDAVRQDLSALPGYDEGLLEFNTGCLTRSKTTGLVNGFNPEFLRSTFNF